LQSEQKALREQIEAAGKNREWQKAHALIAEARSSGPALNLAIYAAAITAMARCKQLHEAERLFAEMQKDGIEPTNSCYNGLRKAYVVTGDMSTAVQLLTEMQKHNVQPTAATYNILMTGQFSNPAAVKKWFDTMQQQGIAPDCHIQHSDHAVQ
jgi:pentatricopeptide repeat protein